MITVYSKPACPFCEAAKNFLDAHALPYRIIDVRQNAEALAYIKEQGHTTVPQLYLGDTLLVEGGFIGMRDLGVGALRARLDAAP